MILFNSIKKYKEAYIAAFVIVLISIYSKLRLNNVENNGVITICRINDYEALSDGSNTYCTVFFNEKKYEVISGMGSKKMIGKYFFVKVLKEKPTYDIVIYDDKEVPNCILNNSLPKVGWKKIPNCP
jgi:hypothetical protein